MTGKEISEMVQEIKEELVKDIVDLDKSYSMNIIIIIVIVMINLAFLLAILLIIF